MTGAGRQTWKVAGPAVAVMAALCGIAWAGVTPDQIATCNAAGVAGEIRIAACTQVVEDTTQPKEVRAEAYSSRGMVHDDDEDYEAAIGDYNEALKLTPEDSSIFVLRGNAFDAMGESQKAINDYTEAIRLNPDDAAPYYNRGAVHQELDDKEKARRDYQKALEIDPNYDAAKEGLAELDKR
jgi:tetratricopeptide (TPR) repeat protein